VSGSPVAVALYVAQALESCGLRYVVGGSLASSISGEPRSTLDVDLVVEISEADVPRVIVALAAEFEVDGDAVMRAVRSRSSVNIFHRPTAIKVDLFVAGGTPLDTEQMERRERIQIGDSPAQHLYVYTPETSSCRSCAGSDSATRFRTVSGATSSASCWCRATDSTGTICSEVPNRSASSTSSPGPSHTRGRSLDQRSGGCGSDRMARHERTRDSLRE
jgi:hypothetical protein